MIFRGIHFSRNADIGQIGHLWVGSIDILPIIFDILPITMGFVTGKVKHEFPSGARPDAAGKGIPRPAGIGRRIDFGMSQATVEKPPQRW